MSEDKRGGNVLIDNASFLITGICKAISDYHEKVNKMIFGENQPLNIIKEGFKENIARLLDHRYADSITVEINKQAHKLETLVIDKIEDSIEILGSLIKLGNTEINERFLRLVCESINARMTFVEESIKNLREIEGETEGNLNAIIRRKFRMERKFLIDAKNSINKTLTSINYKK
ncbi:hypothetical protein KY308_00370 [Candidatus Woesearchaeota archaeon]|nr:hypothetical protein [Candidatus Woesearchaeota archaeon]